MMVPLIRTLQTYLPKTKLTWIISRPAYDLVEGMDGVEFIVIDKPKGPLDLLHFKRKMQGRSFCALLAPQASFRTNILYPFIKAKRKIGYDKLRAKDLHRWFIKEKISPGLDHTVDGFLKFAEPLGIADQVISWNMPISSADYEWADSHLPKSGRILMVNPAASKPERSWSVEGYISVLKQAINRWDLNIILTGGPGAYDRLLADQILQEIPALDCVGKTKPKQLLALISRADAMLCPDTGPSHMATSVNIPVIALHAVTNPLVSGPYNSQHLVVNAYPQAVKEILGLSMEEHVWGTHVHGEEAMKLVTVDEVMTKLSLVFDGQI